MREIKLRYRLKLIEDEFGLYKKGDIDTFYMSLNDEKNGLCRFPIDKRWEIVSCDEYTGLKDKNGKEIYEGDIIDLHQTINGVSKFSVEWCKKRIGYTLRYAQNMVTPRAYEYDVSDVFTIEELEVIGNIHQNPDLL